LEVIKVIKTLINFYKLYKQIKLNYFKQIEDFLLFCVCTLY